MADKPKSHDDESLNFDKLEKELNVAVNADQRYWRENDAKFRALHQKVAKIMLMSNNKYSSDFCFE
jgi:hypothetical protein